MTTPQIPPEEQLPFDIQHQPDALTCGPTCLHAVYRYFGDEVPLLDVLGTVQFLAEGGTLGVLLANHALARGFQATLITWNLQIFDPTWFARDTAYLRERIQLRARAKDDAKLRLASQAYIEFLDGGGKLQYAELDAALLRRYLSRRIPILTGLSATFLYRESRERNDQVSDDIHGEPVGHFAVLTGYRSETREVFVSDPLHPNPLSKTHTYPVKIDRVIGAIYLGVLTYDANLVVIEPAKGSERDLARAHDRRRQ